MNGGDLHYNAAFQETELKFQNITKALDEKDSGNAAYKNKDFATAHLHYDKAIQLDPNNMVFYTNKSAVLFEEERYEECMALCKQALAVGEDNRANPKLLAKAHARMGRVCVKENKLKEAVEHLERSLKENSVDAVRKELDNVKKIIQVEKDFGSIASCEVRPSEVHGRGVFATRDIKRGERVCFYDGQFKTQEQLHKQVREKKIPLNKNYWMAHPSNPNITLCGYVEPQNKHGVAQLINDSKMPDVQHLDYAKGLEECEEYITESRRLANVSFMPEGKEFHVYAICDIPKNNELFLHYGYKMWLQELSEALPPQEYMKKLLYWALDGEITGFSADGQVKMFRACDIEEYTDLNCQGFITMYLRIPEEVIQNCKREIDDFSYTGFLADMVDHIKYDSSIGKSKLLMD